MEIQFKEEKKDLWEYYEKDPGAKVFININGTLKQNGQLVMGRGNAKKAKDIIPNAPIIIGQALAKNGLQVMYFESIKIGIFPVKTQWYLNADLVLIENSAKQLKNIADNSKWDKIVLDRPGYDEGGLEWEVVKKVLSQYFDSRFIILGK